MKKILYVLGIAFLALQASTAAGFTTYYVSPYGADTNNGTALSTPVKTINNALSKAQSSGDIVYVMTGTYMETLRIAQSGITLSAYSGNKPVIDGGTTLPNRDWATLITVVGNYNTISGFEVRNSNITGRYLGGYGIQVAGHHNTVSKMNVHHIWANGILINGDYNIVEDSMIWRASSRNSDNLGHGNDSGLSASRNYSASALRYGITSYATLRRNTVFNNWGEGLSCFEADHCTIEDNIVYDNWTINLYLSDATNSLVQRNMIYVSSAPAIPTRNNSYPPMLLADEVASAPRSTNNRVINNFIYNTDLNLFTWTIAGGLNNALIANNTIVDGKLSTGAGSNSQISNNIILGRNSSVPNNNGITFSNNNWLTTPSAAKSSTDIIADPQVARTGTTAPGTLTPAYFKLLGSSPVIGAGKVLQQVTEDFFKYPRTGATIDIGAYEFQIPGAVSAVAGSGSVTDISPLASVTASSQNLNTNQLAKNVIDEAVTGWPGDYTHEWATIGEGAGAWIQLNWNTTHQVNQVVLYDRPNSNDQITSATLTFSDGSSVTVGTLNNLGAAMVVNFAPVFTNWVRVTVDTVSGSTQNIGLSELDVFGF
jgi:hypothetical protein